MLTLHILLVNNFSCVTAKVAFLQKAASNNRLKFEIKQCNHMASYFQKLSPALRHRAAELTLASTNRFEQLNVANSNDDLLIVKYLKL